MAYDPAKDVRVYAHGEIPGGGGSQILIGVYRYNGTPPKVRINRSRTIKGGEVMVGKLGGMSAEECIAVSKALEEIAGMESVWR